MLAVTEDISIPDAELELSFVRSDGPGGQNVNKVASAVQLRFDVRESPSLPAAVKARLIAQAGSRMTRDGVLILNGRSHRHQARNRQDVMERLVEMIRQAAAPPPPPRRKTKPSKAARRRRMDDKRHRGKTKKARGRVSRDDD